ncbi:ankyrin repeat-containing domain protein [Tricladium varicosporioides]|nr:ankyrin repeat-containing domain protein [Hymenoscyphus varicosporioides]
MSQPNISEPQDLTYTLRIQTPPPDYINEDEKERMSPESFSLLLSHAGAVRDRFTAAAKSGDLRLMQSIFADIGSRSGLDREVHEQAIYFRFSSAMGLAANNGHAETVSCMLEHGAKPSLGIWDAVRQEAGAEAAIRVFEVLFAHGLDLRERPGDDLIHTCVYDESKGLRLLEYLLLNGADPNGLLYGKLPFQGCRTNAAIGVLIDYGADIERSNFLHEAITNPDDEECIKRMEFLIQKGVDIDNRAVFVGESEVEPGSRAYKRGVAQTLNEGTPLHWAVRMPNASRGWSTDCKPRVKWLLDNGADANIKDNAGLQPIHYAQDEAMEDLLNSHKTGTDRS